MPRSTTVLGAALRPVLASTLAALAGSAAIGLPAARAAAPAVDLQPQALARGADIAVPHVEDGVFVDGERRIELPGSDGDVLGASGAAWIAATWTNNRVGEQRRARIVRVEPDGTVRTIFVGFESRWALLSEDGSRLVTTAESGHRRAAVTVRSAADGSEVRSRVFDGWPQAVTADDRKVVVQTIRRTVLWRVGPDRVRTVTRDAAGAVSIEHDLLATSTDDPYIGGCTRLVRLSDPSTTVWRSCKERVAAISPDGTQLLTFHILTDGVGPGRITLRTLRGQRLVTWTTGWFSGWQWESPGTVLLEVNGTRKSATVRCTLAECETATDPVKVTPP
jgi:hypothetical protein